MFYGWIVCAAASAILFLTYGVQYSFGVFLSAMLQDLGWSRATLAGAFSVYGLVYVSLSFLSGRLTDRFGPRRVVTAGAVFLGLGLAAVYRVEAPLELYLAYGVVAGIGMSAAYVPCNATVVRWFEARRGLAVGIVGSGASLGIATVPPLCEFAIGRLGWRQTYLVVGGALLVLLVGLARVLVRDPRERGLLPDGAREDTLERAPSEPSDSLTLAEALRTRAFWLIATGTMFCLFTIPAAYVHLPQHARDLGTVVARARFLAVVGIAALVGNLLLGWLSDRLGRRGALLLSLAIGGAAFAGLARVQSPSGLYAAAAAFGLYYGTFASLLPAVVGDRFGPLHVGAISGLTFALGSVASALGPFVTGAIADRSGSYASAFAFCALLQVVALLLVAGAGRPTAYNRD